ncbi:MAG: phosphoribosylamine--glycine ligase [Sulfobacillus sp.]
MKKVLLVGSGGRESALASKLAEDARVYAAMSHRNPTLAAYTEMTGGRYLIGNPSNGNLVARWATEHGIDLAFVSADEPLAAGVVDHLTQAGIVSVGPTKEGARIEWDKEFAMDLMQRLFPEMTPRHWVVRDDSLLDNAIREIAHEKIDIVVKPQGLTGGKGVKVMGAHLADLDAAEVYAQELLVSRPDESVLLVEKVSGIEFTIMFLTDGVHVVPVPATYDYPYRFDGDTGPGTGGMGAFTGNALYLPFMSPRDYDTCLEVAKTVLAELRGQGKKFSGVLNAGFFLTAEGLKFLEFNARFGDPECLNIMTVLDGGMLPILEAMANTTLMGANVRFTGKASVVKYLVSPEYAVGHPQRHEFTLGIRALREAGIHVFFSAAEHLYGNRYATIGNSRCVALATSADSTDEAAQLIESAIARFISGPLHWRKDIGTQGYLENLDGRARCRRRDKP